MLTHQTHQCMDIMVILDSWILPSWILSINDDNDDYGLPISQPPSSGILSSGFTWISQLFSYLRSVFSPIDTGQESFMVALCIWVRRKVLTISEASGGGVAHECGLRHRPCLCVPLSIGAQGGDHHWDHIHVVGSCTDDGSCVLLRP